MSVEAMAIAMHHSRARGTAKLVLIGIANHDGDGGAWPSKRTLAKYGGTEAEPLDRSTVRKILRQLEELGEIRCDPQAGGTRDMPDWDRPNLYHFLVKCPPECDRTTNHRGVEIGKPRKGTPRPKPRRDAADQPTADDSEPWPSDDSDQWPAGVDVDQDDQDDTPELHVDNYPSEAAGGHMTPGGEVNPPPGGRSDDPRGGGQSTPQTIHEPSVEHIHKPTAPVVDPVTTAREALARASAPTRVVRKASLTRAELREQARALIRSAEGPKRRDVARVDQLDDGEGRFLAHEDPAGQPALSVPSPPTPPTPDRDGATLVPDDMPDNATVAEARAAARMAWPQSAPDWPPYATDGPWSHEWTTP